MKRAYIGGTFDMLHPGHLALLRRAKAEFGEVWVALNTDEFTARYKRKPVMSYKEREEMLKECRLVDGVVKNIGGADSRPSILKVKPVAIIHGDDWVGDALMHQLGIDEFFLKEHGIRMVYYPYTGGVSTSEIIRRCKRIDL
jgi:glycerol-3-phosphate cytidylyltransferase